eukprot:351612-Chlamydomonas_euryale.AAC.4
MKPRGVGLCASWAGWKGREPPSVAAAAAEVFGCVRPRGTSRFAKPCLAPAKQGRLKNSARMPRSERARLLWGQRGRSGRCTGALVRRGGLGSERLLQICKLALDRRKQLVSGHLTTPCCRYGSDACSARTGSGGTSCGIQLHANFVRGRGGAASLSTREAPPGWRRGLQRCSHVARRRLEHLVRSLKRRRSRGGRRRRAVEASIFRPREPHECGAGPLKARRWQGASAGPLKARRWQGASAGPLKTRRWQGASAGPLKARRWQGASAGRSRRMHACGVRRRRRSRRRYRRMRFDDVSWQRSRQQARCTPVLRVGAGTQNSSEALPHIGAVGGVAAAAAAASGADAGHAANAGRSVIQPCT